MFLGFMFYSVKHLRCPKVAIPRLHLINPSIVLQGEKKDNPTLSNHRATTESQVPAFRRSNGTRTPCINSGGNAFPFLAPPLLPLQRSVATVCLERKYLLSFLLLPATPPTCPLATEFNAAGHGRRENRGTLSPAQRSLSATYSPNLLHQIS